MEATSFKWTILPVQVSSSKNLKWSLRRAYLRCASQQLLLPLGKHDQTKESHFKHFAVKIIVMHRENDHVTEDIYFLLSAFLKPCSHAKPIEKDCPKQNLVEGTVEENEFSNMPVASSSKPIPEGWKLVVEKQKDGSKNLSYVCPDTCQIFNDYDMLMRYVNYAKVAKLSIYSPDFVPIPWMKKTRKSKKQKFPGKALRRSGQHKNLPGKTIPRSARHQGNGTSNLKKSPEDGGLALKLEDSSDELVLPKKDFRLKYFRRRYRN